jgi:hypothetical protein
VVSCPAANRLAATRATVLDVVGELLVEELQRVERQGVVAGAPDGMVGAGVPLEHLREQLVIRLRNSEQVGDHQHGERVGEPADELAASAPVELVDLAVGEAPHELLVLAEALGRDQPHQEGAVIGVPGRIERDDLISHRELVTVLLDQPAHIVALEGNRESGKRSGHRIARRERRRVVVDRDGFVIARDHEHVMVRFTSHGALLAEVIEVGVRIGDK